MLVVDAANVVGARPDGWWRDRAAAAAKLCAALRDAVGAGRLQAPIAVVLEGRAREGVAEGDHDGVRVVHATASGDDAIAALAAGTAAAGAAVTVVTADRELRARTEAAGCEVRGPRWLLDRLERGEPDK